jgi:uncharacterized protein (TIGR00251 family)
MDSLARPWRAGAEGLTIVVRLTPKGGRDAIDGIEQLGDGRTALKVRVRAPPFEGEANAALVRLMAKALGVAARQVSVAAGASARIKRLQVAGAPVRLANTLENLCARAAAES